MEPVMNKTFFDKSTLHPREERKLRALGRRKLIKAWILTILWYAAVMGGWAYITVRFNRSITHPGSFIFLFLLALPIYPLKIYRVLFAKSFYATVGEVKFSEAVKLVVGRVTIRQARNLEYEIVSVTFHGDNGEKQTITYKEANVRADNCYYKFGDRVLVLPGLKYPVKVPIPEKERMLCPVCGVFMKKGERRCSWCKANFE